MDIPQQVKDLINQVVEQDEGGWVLTHNTNDPDGGWTFGGLVCKDWIGCPSCPELSPAAIRQAIEDCIRNKGEDLWIGRGIEIYYTKFYIPLAASLTSFRTEPEVEPYEFSCYIQMPAEFHNIVAAATKQSHFGWKQCFCKAWMDHYIQLVKKNAEAWRDYATDQQLIASGHYKDPHFSKPATLRAEFLQGWFNRVWRYLP